MRKSLFYLMTSGVLISSIFFSGCGKQELPVELPVDPAVALGLEGKVLNIFCFDTGAERLTSAYLPGYVKGDDETVSPGAAVSIHTGMIGDIKVRWTIVKSSQLEYQNLLDDALLHALERDADERVDLFMVRTSDLAKYSDPQAEVALTVNELGTLPEEDSQFPFTTETVLTSDEELHALTLQVPAGAFVYRRDIAKEILGTDDPAEVGSMISDWTLFGDTASKMKAGGYSMLTGWPETFSPFLSSVGGWVDDGDKITLLPEVMQWVELNRTFSDNGYYAGDFTAGEDFSLEETQRKAKDQFVSNEKVFGAFFTSLQAEEYLTKENGSYAVCEGPAAYYESGSWVMAAKDTDNKGLIKELINTFMLSGEMMEKITRETGVLMNHVPAMECIAEDRKYVPAEDREEGIEATPELAASEPAPYQNEIFEGQNDISYYVASAKKCVTGDHTPYDSVLEELFAKAFSKYFSGEICESDALIEFYQEALTHYPDLLDG